VLLKIGGRYAISLTRLTDKLVSIAQHSTDRKIVPTLIRRREPHRDGNGAVGDLPS
jgi:hypothetical protein